MGHCHGFSGKPVWSSMMVPTSIFQAYRNKPRIKSVEVSGNLYKYKHKFIYYDKPEPLLTFQK